MMFENIEKKEREKIIKNRLKKLHLATKRELIKMEKRDMKPEWVFNLDADKEILLKLINKEGRVVEIIDETDFSEKLIEQIEEIYYYYCNLKRREKENKH